MPEVMIRSLLCVPEHFSVKRRESRSTRHPTTQNFGVRIQYRANSIRRIDKPRSLLIEVLGKEANPLGGDSIDHFKSFILNNKTVLLIFTYTGHQGGLVIEWLVLRSFLVRSFSLRTDSEAWRAPISANAKWARKNQKESKRDRKFLKESEGTFDSQCLLNQMPSSIYNLSKDGKCNQKSRHIICVTYAAQVRAGRAMSSSRESRVIHHQCHPNAPWFCLYVLPFKTVRKWMRSKDADDKWQSAGWAIEFLSFSN